MNWLSKFLSRYNVDTVTLKIKNKKFNFFLPKDITEFLNQDKPFHGFPLWAKIWEGAVVLADYISRLKFNGEKTFLEIGAGIGIVGIVIGSFGHKVTISDYNEDALNFARANVCKNLDNTDRVNVKFLDWRKPDINQKYDYIVGSDIIYREQDFDHLLRLFKIALKNNGEIILAESFRKSSLKFFEVLHEKHGKEYNIMAIRKVLRSSEEEVPIILAKIQPILS